MDANEVIKLIKSAIVDTGTEDHKIQAIKHRDYGVQFTNKIQKCNLFAF